MNSTLRLTTGFTSGFTCLLLAIANPAWSQQGSVYPSKSVRIIVASPPGSGADVMMRQLTPEFSKRIGQSFIVDNRPGAAGGIGLDALANAAPDGHTVGPLIAQNVAAMVVKTINLDIPKALSPVMLMVSQPYMVVASPKLPGRSIKELIAIAKKEQLAYASSGPGSIVHLGMELLNAQGGVSMTHVAYKGSADMLADIMSNRVQVGIINALSAGPFVSSGKVKALAVTSSTRARSAPDIPTVAESGMAGYELLSWYGLAAPKATPPALVSSLNGLISKVLNAPEVKAKFESQGAEVAPSNTPEEFAKLVASEATRWDVLLKSGKIKLD